MSERDRGQAAPCSKRNKPCVLHLAQQRLGLGTRNSEVSSADGRTNFLETLLLLGIPRCTFNEDVPGKTLRAGPGLGGKHSLRDQGRAQPCSSSWSPPECPVPRRVIPALAEMGRDCWKSSPASLAIVAFPQYLGVRSEVPISVCTSNQTSMKSTS